MTPGYGYPSIRSAEGTYRSGYRLAAAVAVFVERVYRIIPAPSLRVSPAWKHSLRIGRGRLCLANSSKVDWVRLIPSVAITTTRLCGIPLPAQEAVERCGPTYRAFRRPKLETHWRLMKKIHITRASPTLSVAKPATDPAAQEPGSDLARLRAGGRYGTRP